MPTIEQNRLEWEQNYDWSGMGEEWSGEWHGSELQWQQMIYPRIKGLVGPNILEIGPGHGRWTNYLRFHCKTLVGVDLSERCVAACRMRFKSRQNLTFFTNDGLSLLEVKDDTIDFIFSFDSLVHCEMDVLEAYIGQFKAKIVPGGKCFIHHSNLSACRQDCVRNNHWRAMTGANGVYLSLEKHGLLVMSQEMIHWGGETEPIDCFTTFCRPA